MDCFRPQSVFRFIVVKTKTENKGKCYSKSSWSDKGKRARIVLHLIGLEGGERFLQNLVKQ